MSAVQEIEVTIRPDGQVRVKVRGVQGESCIGLTRELERYLGGRIVHRQHTDEYHQQPEWEELADYERVR